MKVLVTGGAGFIGSHLCERYLAKGHEVWALDDLSTGRRENLSAAEGNKKLHFVEGSVLEREKVLELVGRCDLVMHLAAAVGVRYIVENPFVSIQTNVTGTEIILEYAEKFRKKVLITSSSEVYGKQRRMPLSEEMDRVLGPTTIGRWSYAATKALDEFLALAYWKTTRLPVVVVRLFNTVGPRQTGRYGMVLPRFVDAALAGEEISVYGTGRQTRTFSHVQDVCGAMEILARIRKAEGQVVNVGGIEEVSIAELARRVKRRTGSRSRIVKIPYAQAYEKDFEDMPRRVPDISKLRALTRFAPRYRLDEIIDSVVICRRKELGL